MICFCFRNEKTRILKFSCVFFLPLLIGPNEQWEPLCCGQLSGSKPIGDDGGQEAAEGGDGGQDLQEDGLLGGRYSGGSYSYGGLRMQNRMGDDGNMYCHHMQSSDMDAFETMDEEDYLMMLDEEEDEEENEEEYWRQWRRWKRKKMKKRRRKEQEAKEEAKEEAL